jgi:hypothetical protein
MGFEFLDGVNGYEPDLFFSVSLHFLSVFGQDAKDSPEDSIKELGLS